MADATDYGDPDYFYGIDYQGRDVGIMWFDNKAEAIYDAEHDTDAKHLPAELVRMRKSHVERSGVVFNYRPELGDMAWVWALEGEG